MSERRYDKATGTAIFGMITWGDSCVIRDDGVFLNEDFRVHSPADTVFDWTPAYDMDWPGSPNPMTAPLLPIPFTAHELAACMLDGPGHGIWDALGRRIGYALDDDALAGFSLRQRDMRDALQNAYALAEKAQLQVGEFDYDEQRSAQVLWDQAHDAENEANTREGVFETGVPHDEVTQRRKRAITSVAALKARAQQSRAIVETKWLVWRKAMVHQLLAPGPTDDEAPVHQAAPEGAGGELVKPVQRTAAQDAAILAAIRNAGHDPKALSVNIPGKPGVKSVIRAKLVGVNRLFPETGTVFTKAWDRLRERGEIADKA